MIAPLLHLSAIVKDVYSDCFVTPASRAVMDL